MKILVLLHGMPPQAGRAVVGSGLRAFANGEGLRHLGHDIHYCTRTEDLHAELRDGTRRDGSRDVSAYTGDRPAPGDPARMARRIGAAPVSDETSTDPSMIAVTPAGAHDSGLAPRGGVMGAPGNPWTFTETHELHGVLRRVDPDVVLVEALEEARRLPDGRFTVILDMFAPRMLEQQFQDSQDEREAIRVLDALQRGDHFIFSNERQKYYHLPLLALAGVDCTERAGGVVPISCPPDLPAFTKPAVTTFIAGGVFWPWADITDGLLSLLGALEDAGDGTIHLYGGEYAIRSDTSKYADPRERLPQAHPQLTFRGMVPIDELWKDYSQASVAFDLMAPNPEREINLSFRQIDYLRCGLPIITSPRQVIADDLLQYGAGWLVEPDDPAGLIALVQRLLNEPETVAAASSAAQRLAADKYVWTRTVDALGDYLAAPDRRRNSDTLVARMSRTQADLWEDHEENKRLREVLGHQHADLGKKTEEVERLNLRIQTLLGTVGGLTDTLGEVSKFKNEALSYLGEQQDASLKEAGELGRELERKALDLHKKQEALERAQKEIDKLKASLGELKTDNETLEARYVSRDQDSLALEQRTALLTDKIESLTAELTSARREASAKGRALAEASRLQTRTAEEYLERLEGAEQSAQTLLEEMRDRLSSALAQRGQMMSRLEEARTSLREGQRQLQGTERESEWRLEDMRGKVEARDKELQILREKLLGVQASRTDLEKDNHLKSAALVEAAVERERLQEEFLGKLRDAEAIARGLIEEARDRALAIDAERGRLDKRANELEEELRETRRGLLHRDNQIAQLNADRAAAAAEQEVRIQQVWIQANRQIDQAKSERERVDALLLKVESRAADLESDVEKKDAALEAARADLDRMATRFLGSIDAVEAGAESGLSAFRAHYEDRLTVILDRAETLRIAHNTARSELALAHALTKDLRADVAKKTTAMNEAMKSRDRLQDEFIERLQAAEREAQGLIADARDRAGAIVDSRAALQVRVQQMEARDRELSRDLERRDAALALAHEELEESQHRIEDLLDSVDKKNDEVRDAIARRDDAQNILKEETRGYEERAAVVADEAKRNAGRLEAMEFERDILRADMAKKDEEIKELHLKRTAELASLDAATATMAAMQEDIDLKATELAALQAAVKTAGETVEALELTLLTKEDAFAKADAVAAGALAEAKFELETLATDLAAKDTALAEVHALREVEVANLDAATFALTAMEADVEAKVEALAAAQEQLKAADERIELLDVELVDMHDALAKATVEADGKLAEAGFELAALTEDLDKKDEEIKELHLKRTAELASLDAATATMAAMQEDIDLKATELAALQAAVKTAGETVEALELTLLTKEDAFAKADAVAAGALAEAKFELETLATDLAAKDTALAEVHALREVEVANLDAATFALTAMEADVEAKVEALAAAQEQLKAADERIELLDVELVDMHDALAKATVEADGKLAEAGFELAALTEDLDKKTAELEEARRLVTSATAHAEEVDAELVSVRDALQEVEVKASGRLEEAAFELASLRADLQTKSLELESIHEEHSTSVAELEAAHYDLEVLREDLGKKTAELDQSHELHEAARSRLEEVEEELVALQATQQTQQAIAEGKLAELEFDVAALRSDLEKKAGELAEAQKQRDQANDTLVRAGILKEDGTPAPPAPARPRLRR